MSAPDPSSLRRLSFGPVADAYDRIRPGYPAELIDDILAYARGPLDRVLEVGAGTGKATRLLAERGLVVHAVEPDPQMAAVLRERVPSAQVSVGGFETTPQDSAYDLLVSAQAWHWVDPQLRWMRAAQVLRSGGALALAWNDDHPADDALGARLQAVHDRWTPDIRLDERLPEGDVATRWPGPFADRLSAFTDLESRRYTWQRELAGADYVQLLSTMSKYRILPEETRTALLGDLLVAAGETVTVVMDTVLHLARRT